ncbi:MAG: type II toxin-antitoxin system HicB family antitoxin [Blastocatellia bacterium]
MKTYDVIIERHNGIFRASIPSLPNIVAEGATRDEAVINAKSAAQRYLLGVEIATVQLAERPVGEQGLSTVEQVLLAAGKFKGDEEAMLQHIEEIYFERRRQREEIERELDVSENLSEK